jgi:uncharacterized protein YndB with AHSA1/START domain
MNTEQQDAVVREVRIAAPADLIFDYFVDPLKMIHWKGISAELDARPGGVYRVDMNGRDVILGEYLEIDRPRRVVMSFGWDAPETLIPAGSTRVEIDLIAEGEHTIVRLTHTGLPSEAAKQHALGWEHYLERLSLAGAGQDPGPDPWIDAAMSHES